MQGILESTKCTVRFSGKVAGSSEVSIRVPPEARKQLSNGKTVLEGVLNGSFPFRAPLEAGELVISKGIQAAAKVELDDEVPVEITRVGEEQEVRVPAELLEAVKSKPSAEETWIKTTPLARREWVLWFCLAKHEETRLKRIPKAVDILGRGQKRICCFPGLNWLTKDFPDAETWAPLPNSKSSS